MKKLAVIVWLAALSACPGQRDEERRAPARTPAPSGGVGTALAPSPSPASGGAATAGTAGTAGGAAAPSATANVGCASPTTLACGPDEVDGCAGGLTVVHVCVAKDAKAGPPCAEKAALSCPAGQVDACLQNPPQAGNHLCVIVAKPAP